MVTRRGFFSRPSSLGTPGPQCARPAPRAPRPRLAPWEVTPTRDAKAPRPCPAQAPTGQIPVAGARVAALSSATRPGVRPWEQAGRCGRRQGQGALPGHASPDRRPHPRPARGRPAADRTRQACTPSSAPWKPAHAHRSPTAVWPFPWLRRALTRGLGRRK